MDITTLEACNSHAILFALHLLVAYVNKPKPFVPGDMWLSLPQFL